MSTRDAAGSCNVTTHGIPDWTNLNRPQRSTEFLGFLWLGAIWSHFHGEVFADCATYHKPYFAGALDEILSRVGRSHDRAFGRA